MLFVFGILGAFMTAFSVWSWRGKGYMARWWTRLQGGEFMTLSILPGMGMFMMAPALLELGGLFVWPAGIFMVLGFFVLFWGLITCFVALFWWPAQRAWGPRWFTRQSAKNRWDGVNDVSGAYAARRRAGSAEALPSWLGEKLASWSGGLVVDSRTRERPDLVSSRGTVGGELWAGEGGLWFAALNSLEFKWTSRARVHVPWPELRRVWTVPAFADSDGRRRGGLLYRHAFRRLAIATNEETFLFEIYGARARDVAEMIEREQSTRVG